MTLREYIAYLGYDTEQFFADVESFYVWTDEDGFTLPTENLEFYLDNKIRTIDNRIYQKRINTFEVTVYAE